MSKNVYMYVLSLNFFAVKPFFKWNIGIYFVFVTAGGRYSVNKQTFSPQAQKQAESQQMSNGLTQMPWLHFLHSKLTLLHRTANMMYLAI